MEPLVLSPTDFIAITNQVLDTSFGFVYIKGEISEFRISKNKWVYFDIKDDYSKIKCFASVFALPGPLQDGIVVQVGGSPKMHPQFGFSFTVQNIQVVGEGSIHQAYLLLKNKLQAEGLFEPAKKRFLSPVPIKIALVASVESAGYADFIKIAQARWPFALIDVYDSLVQGENAPSSLVNAIKMANEQSLDADALVVTRGGGSGDDLACFNDERVVRAIASSRLPTMVAIGHEIDESLSELVADKRASTPSNASELLFPDYKAEIKELLASKKHLGKSALNITEVALASLKIYKNSLDLSMQNVINNQINNIGSYKKLLGSYNPNNVLNRGYAIITSNNQVVTSINQANKKDNFDIQFKDGLVKAKRI
jgi:exodeoxyribonuclease VII large subunit